VHVFCVLSAFLLPYALPFLDPKPSSPHQCLSWDTQQLDSILALEKSSSMSSRSQSKSPPDPASRPPSRPPSRPQSRPQSNQQSRPPSRLDNRPTRPAPDLYIPGTQVHTDYEEYKAHGEAHGEATGRYKSQFRELLATKPFNVPEPKKVAYRPFCEEGHRTLRTLADNASVAAGR
jgi:hypothetical protein